MPTPAYYKPGDSLVLTIDSLKGTGLTSRFVTVEERKAPGRFEVVDGQGHRTLAAGSAMLPDTAATRAYASKLDKYIHLVEERDAAMARASAKIRADYEPAFKPLIKELHAAGAVVNRLSPYR
jgi:hypothetical protein